VIKEIKRSFYFKLMYRCYKLCDIYKFFPSITERIGCWAELKALETLVEYGE